MPDWSYRTVLRPLLLAVLWNLALALTRTWLAGGSDAVEPTAVPRTRRATA